MIDIPYSATEAETILRALSNNEIGLPDFLRRLESMQPGDLLKTSWERNILPWDVIKLSAYTGREYILYKHKDPIHPGYILYCFSKVEDDLLAFLMDSGKISVVCSVIWKDNKLIATDWAANCHQKIFKL